MTAALLRRFFAALLALVAPALAEAEPLLYPQSQWDEFNLYLNQSTASQIESILQGNARFEPLVQYNENSRLRRLSRPVGRLKISHGQAGFSTCTATLLPGNKVMTNHHCIPGTGENGPVVDAKLEMGYYDVRLTGVRSYSVDIVPVIADQAFDVAVLSVAGDPNTDWGHATLSLTLPEESAELLIVHFPGDRPKYVTRGGCLAGPETEPDVAKFAHRCDTLPGSSGAPIFNRDGEVIAVHCCGTAIDTGPGYNYNYGRLLSRINERYDLAAYTPVPDQPEPDLPTPQPPDPEAEAASPATLSPCAQCSELVLVEGSGPVAPFYIATTEVTRAQFQHYIAETGLEFVAAKTEEGPTCYAWTPDSKLRRTALAFGRSEPLSEAHPVNCVSRDDAQAYVDWLNEANKGPPYRLPSEAEVALLLERRLALYDGSAEAQTRIGDASYEATRACRIGNFGDAASSFLWRNTACRDGKAGIAPVGSFAPDAHGVYDLAGNLWEWTAECWRDALSEPARTQGCTAGTVKGGSFDDPVKNTTALTRQGRAR